MFCEGARVRVIKDSSFALEICGHGPNDGDHGRSGLGGVVQVGEGIGEADGEVEEH